MKLPKMSPHSSGQWRVRINKQFIYLGTGKTEAEKKYRALLLDNYGPDVQPSGGITVNDLLDRYQKDYLEVCALKWVKDKTHQLNQAFGPARELYGTLAAESFGPLAFQQVRKKMAEMYGKLPDNKPKSGKMYGTQPYKKPKQRSRSYVNWLCGRLRSAFRWGVEQELVSESCYNRLMCVRELPIGALKLPEGKGVKAVEWELVDAILPYLIDKWADILRLMRYSGARPSEVLGLRPKELVDDIKGMMRYEPDDHKTKKRNRKRVVLFNVEAVGILKAYWPENPEGLFFPRRYQKSLPHDTQVLEQMIKKACKRAKLPTFNPNQIRHTVLTDVSLEHGRETAQAVGGHASVITTTIYDHSNLQRARKAVG